MTSISLFKYKYSGLLYIKEVPRRLMGFFSPLSDFYLQGILLSEALNDIACCTIIDTIHNTPHRGNTSFSKCHIYFGRHSSVEEVYCRYCPKCFYHSKKGLNCHLSISFNNSDNILGGCLVCFTWNCLIIFMQGVW